MSDRIAVVAKELMELLAKYADTFHQFYVKNPFADTDKGEYERGKQKVLSTRKALVSLLKDTTVHEEWHRAILSEPETSFVGTSQERFRIYSALCNVQH